jgi:hypothetical protein
MFAFVALLTKALNTVPVKYSTCLLTGRGPYGVAIFGESLILPHN